MPQDTSKIKTSEEEIPSEVVLPEAPEKKVIQTVDKTRSSNIEDDLGNQLTPTEKTDLTDDGATTIHKHDHGGQDGLADDDHTIYTKADGSRAFTGTGVGFRDEDDMSSDEATAAASQQSIKAYHDARIAKVETFTGNGTYTKPAGAVKIYVQIWGGGGSGGSFTNNTGNAGGGGGGGYADKWFDAGDVGDETVTVGAGGVAVSGSGNGNVGSNTTFGSLLTAFGGGRGGFAASGGNAGGGGGAGFIGPGGDATGTTDGLAGTPGLPFSTDGGTGAPPSTRGTPAILGGGGGGEASGAQPPSDAFYGGAGGGCGASATATSGGTSIKGGNGGDGGDGANGTAGSPPGGGGGGSSGATSGKGGDGLCIVTTYFA